MKPAKPRWTSSLMRSLPNEHGFWVMLGAAILSAQLRSDFTAGAVVLGFAVFVGAVAVASLLHRKIRGQQRAELAASAGLGLAGTPIEMVAGLPLSAVLAGALARVAIFLASSLLVRSAFARSAKKPGWSSAAWQRAALLLVTLAAACLALAGRHAEAAACAIAGAVCVALGWWAPTAKQLKPLGLTLAGLAVGSGIVLAL